MGELKVGDKIAVDERGVRNGVFLLTILRETTTMWITKHTRFRKDNLKVVNRDRFGPFSGRIPTDEDLMSVRVMRAALGVARIKVTAANVDAAEAFIAQVAEVGNG